MSTADVTSRDAPSLIPTPPNFSVHWQNSDDAALFWVLDRMHFPDPISPLDDTIFIDSYEHGLNVAAQTYELPIRFHLRRINTYFYQAIVPAPVPPEEMAAQGERSEAKLSAVLAELGNLWTTDWLPEVQRHLAYWDAFDLTGASMPALRAHLDETVSRSNRIWDIHILAILPSYLVMSMFDELYRDLFGNESAFDAYKLLQGFDNKTLETGRALWQLGRQALRVPEVRAILEERAARDVIPALEQSGAGRAFLADLRAYLEEYGHRADKWEMISPRWIEDPTPVIKNLKDYITQPERDPLTELASLAAEREQALAAVRERLRSYPRPLIDRFEFLLKAAQEANVLTEDHGFWIDYRGMTRVRWVLLEFGRRFVEAGVIDRADDVFYLTLGELTAAADSLSGLDCRRTIAGQRAEMEYFRTIQPPPILGTLPTAPPPDTPLGRAFGKFWGAPPPPSEPDVLRGTAGSPGVVRGGAKVVRSLAEADKLQPGDILVAETTAPPWTPLFATAAAIVTDTGGILSHCAIVAREYRIPAVVGTGGATAAILDGQWLEVDGDAGLVRIIAAD
jgi:phosphohistidine swiveling domain-containing protein